MKIGTSMWGFRDEDIASVLRFCAVAGIESLEAQVHPQAPGHFKPEMSDADIARALNLAASLGISIDALSLSNDFTLAADRLPGEVEKVLAGIRLARRMKIRFVRVFAGFKGVIEQAGIDALRTVTQQASSAGVQLALENHGGVTATAADVLSILDRVAGLGCLNDPVNFARSGQDPLVAQRSLSDRVVYTHVKDLTADGKVCAVGQGVLPWRVLCAGLPANALVVIEQTDPATVREMTVRSAAAIRSYRAAAMEVAV